MHFSSTCYAWFWVFCSSKEQAVHTDMLRRIETHSQKSGRTTCCAFVSACSAWTLSPQLICELQMGQDALNVSKGGLGLLVSVSTQCMSAIWTRNRAPTNTLKTNVGNCQMLARGTDQAVPLRQGTFLGQPPHIGTLLQRSYGALALCFNIRFHGSV
jgi:hypothetical protein